MKKILTIIGVLFAVNATAQNLDTVSVSLTMRSQDWAWGIGKFGAGRDSASRAKVRVIRTAILAAAPATYATNVTINNVPGDVVMYFYSSFLNAPHGVVLQMGGTDALRHTIFTNIRAINNSALQYFIGLVDGGFPLIFLGDRNSGKSIVMDN